MRKLEKFMQNLRAGLLIFIYEERKREKMYTLHQTIERAKKRFAAGAEYKVCFQIKLNTFTEYAFLRMPT